MVDPVGHKLIDRLTTCETRGTPADVPSVSPLQYIPDVNDRFRAVLSEFPELCEPPDMLPQTTNDIVHHIVLRGPPTHCRPRRIAPDKLKIARLNSSTC
ncbi:unnamed protein product [Echinostoma caproni]|uniref:Uncharacterized protein n=1 Tax=Echinostoma caproni TaxID=27848 RepID=A0A183BFY2_9TREM|nr:unnamed protein product [Echinostoma caproni]